MKNVINIDCNNYDNITLSLDPSIGNKLKFHFSNLSTESGKISLYRGMTFAEAVNATSSEQDYIVDNIKGNLHVGYKDSDGAMPFVNVIETKEDYSNEIQLKKLNKVTFSYLTLAGSPQPYVPPEPEEQEWDPIIESSNIIAENVIVGDGIIVEGIPAYIPGDKET